MERKTVLLIIAIAAILGAIAYLQLLTTDSGETTKTEIASNTSKDSEDLAAAQRIAAKDARYPKAVELVAPNAYLNTEPFNLSEHIGKRVIMIDFWTYSCVNCQRTLPYLVAWDAKYRDEGLLIVGVHTPEFAFEKELANVERAVEKYEIAYPVVLDNDRGTWRAYENRYWPRHYLIDIDGFIVDDHIGEGAYVETEEKIQALLAERRDVLGLNMNITQEVVGIAEPDVRSSTAEIYLGYAFSREQLGNPEGWKPGKTFVYTLPQTRMIGKFYLDGSWRNNPDNMQAQSDGRVSVRYIAQSINLVAGSDTPSTIKVIVDGRNEQDVVIDGEDLYALSTEEFDTHEIELLVPKGVRIYTFTFG